MAALTTFTVTKALKFFWSNFASARLMVES